MPGEIRLTQFPAKTTPVSADIVYIGNSAASFAESKSTINQVGLAITTLGTITVGTWNATVVGATYGGTGINNGSNTITLGGNLTTSGANPLTFTTTGTTNVTLPTSGTLVASGTAVSFTSETLTNTTNQLVLGTTNTTTINSVAPSASRIYSLQDSGANSDILTNTYNSGAINFNTIGSNAINFGTGTYSGSITIGNSSGPSTLTLAASGGISVLSTNSPSANVFNIGTTGVTTFSTDCALNLGITNSSDNINIGTNGARTINIGSANTNASTMDITGTSVTLSLKNSGTANIVATGLGTYTLNIGTSSTTTTIAGTLHLPTVSVGVWQGTVIGSTYGGTGVNNGSSTITLAGNLTTSGANPLTFTTTGTTNVTLPTSGTLVASGTAVSFTSETLTNTTNQLVLGTTNTVTITSPSPSASRTYTILDVGQAASFAMNSIHDIVSSSASLVAENTYYTDNATLLTYTLPATGSVGDKIMIRGGTSGAAGFKIAQNASQLIHFDAQVTTTGTGGSIQSGNGTNVGQFNAIQLECIVTNTTWMVTNFVGDFWTIT